MTSRGFRVGVGLSVVALALMALALTSPVARAQEPGVTVINVSPEFSTLDIGTQNGLHHIDVVVSDYNSFGDILQVDVEILDSGNTQIAHVQFLQYAPNDTSQRLDEFREYVGQVLVRDQSAVSYSADPQTLQERTEIRVTFVISQVTGRWLRVTAIDLSGLTASAQVEYLTGTIGGGAPTIHPLVLIMLAVAASVVIVSSRLRREQTGF